MFRCLSDFIEFQSDRKPSEIWLRRWDLFWIGSLDSRWRDRCRTASEETPDACRSACKWPCLIFLPSLTLGLCDGYPSLVHLAGVTVYFSVRDSPTLQKRDLYSICLSGGRAARAEIAVSADGSGAASMSAPTQRRETRPDQTAHAALSPALRSRSISVKWQKVCV